MASELFGRNWRVTVDTLEVKAPIDISFTAKRSLKPEPNTCEIRIFNLSESHRKQIEQAPGGKVVAQLEVGYGKELHRIFLGELRACRTVTEGPDQVTEVSTGDGEKKAQTARLNISLGAGLPVDVGLKKMIATLGIGNGNVDRAVALLKAKGLTQFSATAQVLKGNAASTISDFCRGNGLEWSIQDGAMQVLQLGQPLQGQVFQVSSNSGLIGSPTVDSKGVLHFTTLMLPGLRPGVLVQMNSRSVKGGYRVESCEYTGDSMGTDWNIKCEAKKY